MPRQEPHRLLQGWVAGQQDTILKSMETAGVEDMPEENRVPTKSPDFVGKGGATERNGCPPTGGRSEAAFATTQRKGIGTPAALLNEGKLHLTGCWSEKTRKTYDATVYLEDDGEKTNYRLEFDGKSNG